MNDSNRVPARAGSRRNGSKNLPGPGPDAGVDGVKTMSLRADAAGQATLEALHRHCGTTTVSRAIWTALNGYVRTVEALKASRQREAALRRQLRELLDAHAEVLDATVRRDAVHAAGRELLAGAAGADLMERERDTWGRREG